MGVYIQGYYQDYIAYVVFYEKHIYNAHVILLLYLQFLVLDKSFNVTLFTVIMIINALMMTCKEIVVIYNETYTHTV